MIDVYVLDKELNTVGLIDSYRSLIWANRYRENGDCELYLEASARNIELLRMGYYLMRADDDMICRINKIELTTGTEDGNYLTVTGIDAKAFLDQRIIWTTSACNGNVEQFIRQLVKDAIISPTDARRAVNLITLGALAGLTDTAAEQVSYKNLGEKIREYCSAYGWGYRFRLNEDNKFAFELYAGADRSENVMFSDQYENLSSSQYTDSCEEMNNVALIGGQGEGSARLKGTLGTASGEDRYEQFIDADDLSPQIKYEELTATYAGGSVISSGSGAIYRLSRLDVQIIDEEHLSWLQANYSGETMVIDGVRYYRLTNIAIADLPDTSPTAETDVTLREIVYHSYLLNRGVEQLAGFGEKESFEGTIIPDVTFIYKQDYFLGDIVNVENEFGISADARIIEIIESVDENGYNIEPTFEYLGINQTIQTYLLTQDDEILLAENEESGLITEDSPITRVATTERPAGVKISELPQVIELDGSYYMPFATDSETVKASYNTLKNAVQGDIEDEFRRTVGVFYGTCATASGSSVKVVTCPEFRASDLIAGTMITVAFDANNAAGTAYLNINGTGANEISRTVNNAVSALYFWGNNTPITFVFDGTRWVIVDCGLAGLTYYGRTKLENSVTSTSNSTAATPNAVKTAYDHATEALTFKEYPITRTENSYANATSVARLKLYRMGRMGILFFNFSPSTSIPANTAAFEIGRFNAKLINAFYISCAGQSNSAVNLYVNISTMGVLTVGNYNASNASGTGFFRGMIPVMFASDSP